MGNVFNRCGAGGGKSEGLYIWKKYEYIPSKDIVNPTMNVTVETTNLYINSASFDYSGFPTIADYVDGSSADSIFLRDFLSGFSDSVNSFSVSNNSLYFLKGTTMYQCRNAKPSTNGRYYVMLNSNTYLNSTTTFTYNGTKTIPAKIGDMVGYVVSDKENEYPDKEVKDGYYYEKCNSASLTELLELEEVEKGTVTITGTQATLTINLNMSKLPKFAYLWSDNSTNISRAGTMFTIYGTGSQTGYTVQATGGTSSNAFMGSTTTGNDTTKISLFANSSYKFTAGTYHYVVVG